GGRRLSPPERRSVVRRTRVPPEKVLLPPLSTNVPEPFGTSWPAPEIGPEIVLTWPARLVSIVGEARITGRPMLTPSFRNNSPPIVGELTSSRNAWPAAPRAASELTASSPPVTV